MTEQTTASSSKPSLTADEAEILERMRASSNGLHLDEDGLLVPIYRSLVRKGYAVRRKEPTGPAWYALLEDGTATADLAPSVVEQTPGQFVSSTGHRWPCTWFYVTASGTDACTCGRNTQAAQAAQAAAASASTPVEDPRAEVDRLTAINRELVETHNNHLLRIVELERERDGLRAQQRAVLDLCADATVRDDADAVLDLVAQVREALPFDVPKPESPDDRITTLVGALAQLCDDEWLRRRDRHSGAPGARRLAADAALEIEFAASTIRQLIKTLPGYASNRSAQAYIEWMSTGRDQAAWQGEPRD